MSAGDELDPRVESLLRAARREEQATLEAARVLDDAPGEELVAGAVQRLAARRRRPGLRWLGVAAAALAAGWLLVFLLRGPTDPPPQYLGAEILSLRAPIGRADERGTFTWDADGAAWFEVLVTTEDKLPLTRSGRVNGHSWSPEPREVSSWPNRIRWEVRAFDASGALLDVESASAWR